MAFFCAAMGMGLVARKTAAQNPQTGTHDSRRYNRQVIFDDGPVAMMAPTQTESKIESLFAPLDFNRSDSRSFDGSIAPGLPPSMQSTRPPSRKSDRKKNWLLPGADSGKDEKDTPETGYGWLADRVDQIRQERSAMTEENLEGEPVTLDQLTRDGQNETSDRPFGFQPQLFEPVLPSDIGADTVADDSPDTLLAGRAEHAAESSAPHPDSTTQSPSYETPDDASENTDAGVDRNWTPHRFESREQEGTPMFSQTREMLEPLTRQHFTPSLQQPLAPLDSSKDNLSPNGMLSPRSSPDRITISSPGFQPASALGAGTGLRPILSEPTRLPGSAGFPNGLEPTRSFSQGVTQPLRPTEPFKPFQDNWSEAGR